MRISGKQIAMARILLDLSQKELADKLGIARKTVMRIENGQSPGNSKTNESLRLFFENNGLEFFEGNGVRESTNIIQKLSGRAGIKAFFDMVYEAAKSGHNDICLFNGVPERLMHWLGEEYYENHKNRMLKIQDQYKYKIIVKDNDFQFIANGFAEYRWFPEKLFNDKTLHSFGSKLAFFDFDNDDVKIMIIDQPVFAESFRILFNIAWNNVAVKPPTQTGI